MALSISSCGARAPLCLCESEPWLGADEVGHFAVDQMGNCHNDSFFDRSNGLTTSPTALSGRMQALECLGGMHSHTELNKGMHHRCKPSEATSGVAAFGAN